MKSSFGVVRYFLVPVTVVLLLAECTKASTDPCLTTQNIGDARRSSQNDPGVCNGLICDNYIIQGPDQWYRLDGDTIGLRMPESCVQTWNCGTHVPVWLNGAHPTSDAPGPKWVQVCAQQIHNENCCAWSDNIYVKRCSDAASREYFVYQLKALPYCDMGYCAGSGQYCPGDSAWNTFKGNCSSPKNPGLPLTKPTLSAPYISSTKTVTVDGTSYTATRFSVNCTLHHTKQPTDDGTRYEVIFEANGAFVAGVTIKATDDTTVVLDESQLVGFLDSNLICKVTSYWQSDYPVRASYVPSNAIYIGIQVIDNGVAVSNSNPLSLTEGLTKNIIFQATFPITSRACYDSPSSSTCNPVYQFRISAKGIKLSACTFQLSPGTAASGQLVVSPTYTIETFGVYYGSMSIAASDTIQSAGSIFKNYQSSQMNVKITDMKAPVYCQSILDPHYTTFQNRYYHVYLTGDLILVRMSQRNLDIQTRMAACFGVSCNCGVMAREGNNILGVDSCNRPQPEYIRYQYDNANPGGNISISPGSFTIRLLSGVQIKGNFWTDTNAVPTKYMDIYVTGLGIETYEGMCSYTGPEGTQCTTQCNFDNSYRAAAGDSLFGFTSSNPPTCKPSPIIPACDCSDNVPCFKPDQSNLKLTEYTCPRTIRTKRDANGNQNPDVTITDIDKLTTNFTIDQNYGLNQIVLTWPTPDNHITKDQAQGQCNRSLTMSPAYDYCINTVKVNTTKIVESCVNDIQLTDNINFAKDAISKCLEEDCGIAIAKFVAGNYSDPASENLQIGLQAFLCPNQCSQNGTCQNGGCICRSGYINQDCSVQRGVAPKVTAIQNSPCDITHSACFRTSIPQTGAVSEGLVCRIKNDTGFVYYHTEPIVTTGWAYCFLQPTPVSNTDPLSESATNYTLRVSISNDNVTYSDELTFVIYDGTCVNCSNKPPYMCAQKANSCSILGRCYEQHAQLQCKMGDIRTCNPNICANKWTYASSRSCNDGIGRCSEVLNSAKTVAPGYFYVVTCLLLFTITSVINIQN